MSAVTRSSDRREAQLVEPRGRHAQGVAGVGQRRPAPQRERLAQHPRRTGRIAVAQRARSLGGQRLEAVRVDVVRLDVEPVAGRRLADRRRRPERAAQPRDERLQRVGLVGRRLDRPTPRRSGRAGATGRPASRASRTSRARNRAPVTSIGCAAVVANLERAEDPHLHPSTVPRERISLCVARPFGSGPAARPPCTT